MIITWICSSVWSKTWVKKIWQISLLEFCLNKAAPSPYGYKIGFWIFMESGIMYWSIAMKAWHLFFGWSYISINLLWTVIFIYLFTCIFIYLFIYLFEKKFFSEFDSVITRIKSGSCKFRDLLPLLASRVCH